MIPEGYISGLDRNDQHTTVTHLYKGDFSDPGLPMCAKGWNRANGMSYSIFRGVVGEAGYCRICVRRACAGKDGVPPRKRKTKWI